MLNNPLEQFKLKVLYRNYNILYDITITNSSILIGLSIWYILYLSKTNKLILRNSYEIFFTNAYNQVLNLVKEILGKSSYFPFIYSLFFFILFNNIFGLFPYSFTTTSHLIINITLSLSIILGTTILGLYIHKWKFFTLFVPSGLSKGPSKYILPLIILIEVISYISRIISLSVRLTANMLSGHILLALISSFGYQLTLIFPFLFFIPVSFLFPFILLELAIAFIQSYVFALLTSSYIKDVIYLH